MADVGTTRSGSVKWYNRDKGFGFIKVPDEPKDIFVHANQLRKCGLAELTEGDDVSFIINQGPKGSFAVNVALLKKSEI